MNTIFSRYLAVLMLAAGVLGLSACGEQLIKPADKHIEAMIQFEMPDFDATKTNAMKKVEKWFVASYKKESGKTQYLSTGTDTVNGRGSVTFQTRSEDLTVSFNIEVTVVKPNLIKFRTYGYKDEPGPRQGDSDRAYVFYNLVKDRVLGLADELESYMDSDTRPDDVLNRN